MGDSSEKQNEKNASSKNDDELDEVNEGIVEVINLDDEIDEVIILEDEYITAEESETIKLLCHKCSKEFDSPFELYKHQNRRHKVEFANSYSYLNAFQNFSLKKMMTKKFDDDTENVGLYIDTINIYIGDNQEIICGRKKLENWVQLGFLKT